MNSTLKSIALWMVVIMITFLLWHLFQASKKQQTEIIFSDFLSQIEKGEIAKVTILGNKITGEYIGNEATFVTYAPRYDNLVELLRKHNVQIEAKEANQKQWLTAIISWAPMILLIGIWIFFMRQMQTGGTKALSFGKSRAKLSTGQGRKVTFKDVAGVDDAKEELQEIIAFLKEPRKFQRLGGRIPKGVLLMGLPGSGKTLLARAIAGEANVPFFSISGSDFVEMFVGVGASRVRDLFEQGKKNAPCIVFIDEIDAVGRYRGAGLGGGHDEREQTLNQLLVEMDGFDTNEGVIIVAATNRPDVLDPALLRPGRFDRRIIINLPDIKGREEILKVHARKILVAKDVNFEIVARGTPGFSGADLENLVNEAALIAARANKKMVCIEDLEYAKDKVLMGAERKSMIISEEEKRNAAYHEAGHALVAMLMPNADPIHKVTIIPRGMALGVTQQLPMDDRHNYASKFLLDQISVLLGGRAAEELLLKDITTGAGNDIEKATELARKMVCEWGMSENLGPLTFAKKDEYVFLGKEFAKSHDYSEDTAKLIDNEIKRIVDECYKKAKKALSGNMNKLLAIANNLLEREVLQAEEIEFIMEGKPLKPKESKKIAKVAEKKKRTKRAKEEEVKKEVKLKTPQFEGPTA